MTPQLAVALAAVVLALAELFARQGGRAWDPPALGLWAIFGLAAGTWLQAPPPQLTERLIGGGGVLGLGVGLRLSAILRLGPRWRGTPGPLVTDHVYSQLRHPGAVGALLAAAGASLVLASGLALAASVAVMIPLVVWTARREDHALQREFAEDWLAYREQVPALVPRARWV